jgi:hypothetical protein
MEQMRRLEHASLMHFIDAAIMKAVWPRLNKLWQ